MMLMLQAMEEQGRSSRHSDFQDRELGDKGDVPQPHKQEALHATNNKNFQPSELKQNVVTDKLFIGSYYVGSIQERNPSNVEDDGVSWRVKI